MATSAGLSAARLLRARTMLTPDPTRVEDTDSAREAWAKILFHALASAEPLGQALFEGGRRDRVEEARLADRVRDLKADARRLHQELVLRLRTTRSHRTLVGRFKLRCESYDRERLRALTECKPNPEAILVVELARYLFDAGLTPLTGPQIGGLKPDQFEQSPHWTLYIEAKQYGSDSDARTIIKQGAAQVWDTAAVLKSLGLREVFLIVFRRGGPHCTLPAELRADGIVVFPVVVSIAAMSESGSRAARPVTIDAADLLPSGDVLAGR